QHRSGARHHRVGRRLLHCGRLPHHAVARDPRCAHGLAVHRRGDTCDTQGAGVGLHDLRSGAAPLPRAPALSALRRAAAGAQARCRGVDCGTAHCGVRAHLPGQPLPDEHLGPPRPGGALHHHDRRQGTVQSGPLPARCADLLHQHPDSGGQDLRARLVRPVRLAPFPQAPGDQDQGAARDRRDGPLVQDRSFRHRVLRAARPLRRARLGGCRLGRHRFHDDDLPHHGGVGDLRPTSDVGRGRPRGGAMSEQPENDGHGASGSPDRVHAGVRHGWWPGWIWAIPIAALLVVIWLGARTLLAGGTDITIRLTDAHNLKKENTDVVFRGTQVGHVTGIELTQDGTGVIVSASIDKDAAKFLTTGTRFWLQGANPSLSNLSSLGSLLSGPTIIMDPGPGKKARHFLGLERAPVDPSATEQPLLYEISLDSEAGALAGGDPVTLRGFTVGEVRDVGFTYDPATGDLATPATLALYPSLFHAKGTRD